MTPNPKIKAKELVDKCKVYAYVGDGRDDELTQEEAAKELALICVDEILELSNNGNYLL